jgi:L-ascorbate metabolism protein UlaG (beta-lactamase superfamily)
MKPSSEDRVTWLGHATILIELEGARLLTDPVMRQRVAHLRRQVPLPNPPGRLDAILLSHRHHDHLDLPSLAGLDPSAPVVVPPGAARSLRSTGRTVIELAPGERCTAGGTTILAVPAVHDGRRVPVGAATDAVGYVVGNGRRVYFAGDTEPFAAMRELGPVDVALLPVWGWGPSLGPGHMDPEEAAGACALLQPVVAIPIHWGTYLRVGMARRHRDVMHEAPRRFAAHVAALAPDTRVAVLEPGGALAVPCRHARPGKAGT